LLFGLVTESSQQLGGNQRAFTHCMKWVPRWA